MIKATKFFDNLKIVLERPGMFGIQKVEDVNIIFLAETFFNRNDEIEKWNERFRNFVLKETNENLEGFNWDKLIRLYSGSDAHSLELFKNLYEQFNENGGLSET